MGATLKDVSYSVKQNGIMVNLDYTEPIDDDDIIGWKSDRGWVYLTLLGVRAPKGKKPQEDFSGEVRKIVIDDFDESTQLAILIRKPILGYDIINSKTSPSTIVFIHTEMKKSEVATLKEYIKEKGTSVFNVAKSSGFPKYNTNFKNAFDEARKELGPNAIFEYHGKLYTTNHPGEKEAFSKSVLTEKTKSLLGKGENNTPTINDILNLTSENAPVEETYVDIDTGDTLTEEIAHSLTVDYVPEKSEDKKDDSWFSGLFPAKKYIEQDSPSSSQTTKKDTLIIKEKPILVESRSKKSKRWSNFFNFLKKRKTDNDEIKLEIVENDLNKADSINKKNEILAQEQYRLLQERYIPAKDQNMIIESIDESGFIESQTQLSDTNIVSTIDFEELTQSRSSEYQAWQKTYVPEYPYSVSDTAISQQYYTSPTQAPDTNVVQAWFNDESLISDEYDATRLQKKYIPSKSEILTFEQDDTYPYETLPQNTQAPDTNVVQAWFIDESIIPDEYDVTRLQKKYIPSEKNNEVFNPIDDIFATESSPQTPEYTDPQIFDRRLKTEFKNRGAIKEYKSKKETPFKVDSTESNTWLSYFPLPEDSIKQSLKWDFRNEREVPRHMQNRRQSLDYYEQRDNQYQWREKLSQTSPKSFPKRKADPTFSYYHNGGIRVESNLDGVPIYIDGKYVGETPLNRPIEVEPGWHQVSGFTPIYTNLASKGGLQYVGYGDSIIENNELYGATTVYAESGKLETVELRFNKMGDTPKKWIEMQGGMNIGLPMFVFVMSMILYSM
jgi:hypothetical protein